MRYIVEAENNEELTKLSESGLVTVVDSYDPIERLTGRVEKLSQAFTDFKKNRGSWTILNYYLRGRGISQSEIDNVLGGVEEFMSRVK